MFLDRMTRWLLKAGGGRKTPDDRREFLKLAGCAGFGLFASLAAFSKPAFQCWILGDSLSTCPGGVCGSYTCCSGHPSSYQCGYGWMATGEHEDPECPEYPYGGYGCSNGSEECWCIYDFSHCWWCSY